MVNEEVALPGATLSTYRSGQGAPLVLLHGGPGGEFAPLARVASMIDYVAEVFGYDQRASGRSTGEGPFTVATWLEDLQGLRVHWEVESWIVAGHSFGAALALAYAALFPSRSMGLIFMSCLPALMGSYERGKDEYRQNRLNRIPPEERSAYDALRQRREGAAGDVRRGIDRSMARIAVRAEFADKTVADQYLPEILDELERTNWVVNRELGDDYDRFASQPSFDAGVRSYPNPALVIHGDPDCRPMWAAEELTRRLPNARLLNVRDAGHLPWLERESVIRKELREFVSTI